MTYLQIIFANSSTIILIPNYNASYFSNVTYNNTNFSLSALAGYYHTILKVFIIIEDTFTHASLFFYEYFQKSYIN